MATISLCIIVRNEQNILEKCLSSVVAIADEIIIVDTGSTDQTVEIAQKFVEQVYHFNWIDDFAAARNYAQSLATCDYIFRMDADCTLKDGNMQKLLALKARNFDNADLIQFNFIEHFKKLASGEIKPLFKESTIYLYKKTKFRWQLPIHEYLVPVDINFWPNTLTDESILVLHHRAEADKPWRIKQNLDILKKSVDQKCQNYERMLQFYARDLYFDGQYGESIKQFKKLLECKITSELRVYAIDKIFFCLFYSKRHNRIPEFKNLLESNHPNIILLAGDVACLSDPAKAQDLYLQYIQKPLNFEQNSFEYDVERYQIHPYIQLGKIYIQQNKLMEAKRYLQTALQKAISESTIERIKSLLDFCKA